MSLISPPTPTLPYYLEGYGFPKSENALLPWSYVSERMSTPQNYWVCTITPSGKPHARPIWGVWVDDRLYFGGGPDTRWFRNLKVNPKVTVHLEDGSETVILEGKAILMDDNALAKDGLMTKIDDAYEAKYGMRHGPPIWQLQPDFVFAWQSMETVTRFVFNA